MDPRKIRDVGFLIILCLLVFVKAGVSQHRTKLVIKPSIPNPSLQRAIEESLSSLLSKLNEAYHYKTSVSEVFPKLLITESGKRAVVSFIEKNGNYECIDTKVEAPLNAILKTDNYEIGAIKVRADGKDVELIKITLDKEGRVTGFGFDQQGRYQYETFLKGNFKQKDNVLPEYQKSIIDIIRQLEVAYNRRDLKYLDNVFSDDAVIITGSEIKVSSLPKEKTDRGATYNFYRSKSGYVYRLVRQTKEQYMNNLKYLFSRTSSLNIELSRSPEIAKHPTLENVYGALVLQTWKSTTYTDKGYIFLSIDFRRQKPVLKARRWMPEDSFSSEEAMQLLIETISK